MQPTHTDNWGNSAALNKLMSSQFPINAVLMELAVHCKRSGVVPVVGLTLREFNREADDLANGRVHAFDPAIEVKLDPRDLDWHILSHALKLGQEAEDAYRTIKDAGMLPNRGEQTKRSRPEQRLRLADPW